MRFQDGNPSEPPTRKRNKPGRHFPSSLPRRISEKTHTTILWCAGLLAGLRAQEQRACLLASPSRIPRKPLSGVQGSSVELDWLSFSLTAAGQLRIHTGFPFSPTGRARPPAAAPKADRNILWFACSGQPIYWGAHQFSALGFTAQAVWRFVPAAECASSPYSGRPPSRRVSAARILPRVTSAHSSGVATSVARSSGRIRTRT